MNPTESQNFLLELPQLPEFQNLVHKRHENREAQELELERRLPALPAIIPAMALVSDESIVTPPELIAGVLHQGLKAIIGSNSKARKTWILLDLALSVATGTNWWKFTTVQSRVLFVNFELLNPFLKQRIKGLAAAKQLADYSQLDTWTLRGQSSKFSELIPAMVSRIMECKYGLIIIDPIYKGLSGKDENSAGDIGSLCDLLEQLAVKTGAAVLYAHHFSKGKQAGKDPIDRFSGSGVFARDADSIIVLTKHEVEDCYTVEMRLRNLSDQRPFVVGWDYPRLTVREHLDPSKLEGSGGRPKKSEDRDFLELLRVRPLSFSDWRTRAEEELKASASSVNRARKRLAASGQIEKDDSGRWRISGHLYHSNPGNCLTGPCPDQNGGQNSQTNSQTQSP